MNGSWSLETFELDLNIIRYKKFVHWLRWFLENFEWIKTKAEPSHD